MMWTRGRWIAEAIVGRVRQWRVALETAGTGVTLATVREEGDAHMMAAAPELYEALKWCVDTMRERSPEVLGAHPEGSLAVAALAKAEGRR